MSEPSLNMVKVCGMLGILQTCSCWREYRGGGQVEGSSELTYRDGLHRLDLVSFQGRCHYGINPETSFTFFLDTATRGHQYKLYVMCNEFGSSGHVVCGFAGLRGCLI